MSTNKSLLVLLDGVKNNRAIFYTKDDFDVKANGSCLILLQAGAVQQPKYGQAAIVKGIRPDMEEVS